MYHIRNIRLHVNGIPFNLYQSSDGWRCESLDWPQDSPFRWVVGVTDNGLPIPIQELGETMLLILESLGLSGDPRLPEESA